MPDMLDKLYELPDAAPALKAAGILVWRANAREQHALAEWVRPRFGVVWAIQRRLDRGCEVALEQRPVTYFTAVKPVSGQPAGARPADRLLGFACDDVAGRGVFGATGVQEDYRGRGTLASLAGRVRVGTGLLLACRHTMRAEVYPYAVTDAAGPVDFYIKTVRATVIAGSDTSTPRRAQRGSEPQP